MSTSKKVAVLGALPSLALGLAALPAFAYVPVAPAADVTTVSVTNTNVAGVTNAVILNSSTGYNTANGGNGAKGGKGGSSGSDAGNGGEGGNGGDASGAGDNFGGTGSMGGNGGWTGDAGMGGNGGMGGLGGLIITGDATAASAISNDVNHNSTKVTLQDCGCDRYNVWTKDTWFSKSTTDKNKGHRYGKSSSTSDTEKSSNEYKKTAVPQVVTVSVGNANLAEVANVVAGGADTGKNYADGGDAGKGGKGGSSGSDAGNGGEGGNGGDAEGNTSNGYGRCHHGCDAATGTNLGGDAGIGGVGGSTGNGADAGNGGDGAMGGTISTGKADVISAIANVVNKNVTRIVRGAGL